MSGSVLELNASQQMDPKQTKTEGYKDIEVEYEMKWYLGQVIDINDEDGELHINFL